MINKKTSTFIIASVCIGLAVTGYVIHVKEVKELKSINNQIINQKNIISKSYEDYKVKNVSDKIKMEDYNKQLEDKIKVLNKDIIEIKTGMSWSP